MRKQIAIRVEEELLLQLKIKLIKENKTLQDYLVNLIIKDMEENKDVK